MASIGLGVGVGIGASIFKARTRTAHFHNLLVLSSSPSSLNSHIGRRIVGGGVFLSRPSHSPPTFCTSPNTTPATTTTDTQPPSDSTGGVNLKDTANLLDIRVGRIIKAWRHEEADSLYVEEVDVGESEPRIICSGLVNYIPVDNLYDAKVVVLANLKPRNMRGVKSNGMLLAASDASHQTIELLQPPHDSLPGERIWFGSPDGKESQPPPATPNQVQKKKIWEMVQPHLKTDGSCVAVLEGEHLMQTSQGPVKSTSLNHANIA